MVWGVKALGGLLRGKREAKVMVDLVWGHIRHLNRHVVTDVRGAQSGL